jgi:hypothetical protein
VSATSAHIDHLSTNTAAIAIGSPAHRELLARFFVDSHVDFVPEAIQWPALNEADRERLTSLPFWQEAVSTENVTSNTVTAAVQLESNPQLREAIALQGFEEKRHARLLLGLTSHYRIPIESPPEFEPGSAETAFLRAGFGECFDSFFAFGLFALARDSGHFPSQLVTVFEPVMQEEARHILFFVNWVKYRRSQLPHWKRAAFRLRCAWAVVRTLAVRIQTARTMGKESDATQEHFTMSAHQELGFQITVRTLLDTCLKENDRRMAPYDARLPRPRLAPGVARLAYRLLPART